MTHVTLNYTHDVYSLLPSSLSCVKLSTHDNSYLPVSYQYPVQTSLQEVSDHW